MAQQKDNPVDENGYPVYGTFRQSTKQQTAVEWLMENIQKVNKMDWDIVYIQAKEMEKEQIMYAFNWAAYEQASNRELDLSAAEVYYNKKYKK